MLYSYQFYNSDLKEFIYDSYKKDNNELDDIEKYVKKKHIKIKFIATFSKCYLLHNLILDNIDVSKLTSIRSLCSDCKNLSYISMKNWYVKKLINCDFCFSKCYNLKIIEIEWYDINEHINCFMTLFESNPFIISNSEFRFNINTSHQCPID